MSIRRTWVFSTTSLRSLLGSIESSFVVSDPDNGSHGLGWLLTDRIFITLPNLLPDVNVPLEVIQQGKRSSVLLQRGAEPNNDVVVAFGRLEFDSPGGRLGISMRSVRAGDDVALVYYDQNQQSLCMSLGRIVQPTEWGFEHDAAANTSSAGGLLIDNTGQIVGLQSNRSDAGVGHAFSVPCILRDLRSSGFWNEIALKQGLRVLSPTKMSAIHQVPENLLLELALRWDFDPSALTEQDRQSLIGRVRDPSENLWSLTSSHRIEILSTFDRQTISTAASTIEPICIQQRIINKIATQFSPEFDDTELPYATNIVSWFQHKGWNLPNVVELQKRLSKQDLRMRLSGLVETFSGRAAELELLAKWFGERQPVVLEVSGLGGMGKSALFARFALGLPASNALFWLDFDRPDIIVDDSRTIVDALERQCEAQLDGWKLARRLPSDVESDWMERVRIVGRLIDQCLDGAPALLVLDSFEIAQHSIKVADFSAMLATLRISSPSLRIAVVGRVNASLAIPSGSVLRLELSRLTAEDETAMLRKDGLDSPQLQSRLALLCRGVPLKLKLALLLWREGGELEDLPKRLEDRLVEGYLYGRILDRVVTRQLRPLARAILTVRRLTIELLAAVFREWIPAQFTPQHTFALLQRELAMVEGTEVLVVRSEVRTSALALLEKEEPEFVRAMDSRVSSYYASLELRSLEELAELIYHTLRTGQTDIAEQFWNTGQSRFGTRWEAYARTSLSNSEEVPSETQNNAPSPRDWLRQRLSLEAKATEPVEQWESTTLKRIARDVENRVFRHLSTYLGERAERSANSELFFFDVWTLARSKEYRRAKEKLEKLGEIVWGRVDLLCLGAWIAQREDDTLEADRFLSKALLVDREKKGIFQLDLLASLGRNSVILGWEAKVASRLRSIPGRFQLLSRSDFLLPSVKSLFPWAPPPYKLVPGDDAVRTRSLIDADSLDLRSVLIDLRPVPPSRIQQLEMRFEALLQSNWRDAFTAIFVSARRAGVVGKSGLLIDSQPTVREASVTLAALTGLCGDWLPPGHAARFSISPRSLSGIVVSEEINTKRSMLEVLKKEPMMTGLLAEIDPRKRMLTDALGASFFRFDFEGSSFFSLILLALLPNPLDSLLESFARRSG